MATKTFSPKPREVTGTWRVVDAQGLVLGRLATEVAQLLMGKHKPIYARHVNTGDFVIVINAAKVDVTGNKRADKLYYRHSGYMGNLRSTPLWKMLETHPERVIQSAVKGMLPKNSLGAQMLRRLKVYPGPEHPHEAQVKGGERAHLLTPQRPVKRKKKRAQAQREEGTPEAAETTSQPARTTGARQTRRRRPRQTSARQQRGSRKTQKTQKAQEAQEAQQPQESQEPQAETASAPVEEEREE